MCLIFLSERAEHGAVGHSRALMGGVRRMRAHEGALRRMKAHQGVLGRIKLNVRYSFRRDLRCSTRKKGTDSTGCTAVPALTT